jgi:hypothetical protein
MLLVRSRVVFSLLLFLLPLTSHAATITFYDMRSDWKTAVGGVCEEEDFNDGLTCLSCGLVITTVPGSR